VRIDGTAGFRAYTLQRSAADPDRVWVGMREGLGRLQRVAGTWRFEPPPPGSHDFVRAVVEQGDTLWCGTIFSGIVRYDLKDGVIVRTRHYGSGEIHAGSIDGQPRFTFGRTGQISLIDAAGRIVPDPEFAALKSLSFFDFIEDSMSSLWINSAPPAVLALQFGGGHYAKAAEPLVAVGAADIQKMRADANGVVWFVSNVGLFRFEPVTFEQGFGSLGPSTQPAPIIRRITGAGDRLLARDPASAKQPSLPFDFKRIRIEYAPASYRPGVQYQYRLDPLEANWSAWTQDASVDFTNLDSGHYTFRVRSRGRANQVSPEAKWMFEVQPPWYRSAPAIALWVLAALGILVLYAHIRNRVLLRRARELQARVGEQTVELTGTVVQLRQAQESLVKKNEMLEQVNARLETLSLLDDLTALPNRRFFQNAMLEEWMRAAAEQRPVSVILADLDHFKILNDTLGHSAGDASLRVIGRFLGEAVRRPGHFVARYGGEEFIVVLPSVELREAERIAGMLRDGIVRLRILCDREGGRSLTASFGVATAIPQPEQSFSYLVDKADHALYEAKHAGRNCVRTASPDSQRFWLRTDEGE
jgi:diguanylate cyclase (GGDEF)-like protein